MDTDLPELGNLFFQSDVKPLSNTYTKRTLLHSPLINAIYPDFKVSLTKPLTGLTSTSINDENDQTLHAPEQDSYFGDDMSEDDDIVWNLDENDSCSDSQRPQSPLVEDEITTVKVLVKTTSIMIEGVEFGLNSGVRSSIIIPGTSGSEDSLLLSIQSGFLLLIRIWRVPRTFGDASFVRTTHYGPPTTTTHFYKPFVVQWWKTLAENLAEMSGSQLSAHASGMAVVSASPSSVFRIHMCQNTDSGVQLLPHFNVPVNGIILHSCFSQPLKGVGDDHLMFLVLTFTNVRRLDLLLYSWYVSDALSDDLTRSILPLNNSFPFPVMIVPLATNHSFLFICADMFIVVTVHNITSADYSFSRFAYDGAFPTSFYLPESPFLALDSEKTDEVLLASESGVIYSIVITDNKSLTYDAIAQVADPVSVFTFQKYETGYRLNYASDTGGSKELQIAKLFTKDLIPNSDKKLPYSEAILIQDFKNWGPVIDVLVIESYQMRSIAPYCSQDVWALTGVGRRTKLTQLRSGYSIKKETKPVGLLRKTDSMYHLDLYNRHFIICSMPFATKLLEYQGLREITDSEGGKNDSLIEIECPAIIPDETTLLAASIPNSTTIVQFTSTRIAFTNLEQVRVLELPQRRLLHVKVADDIAALLIEQDLTITLEIIQLAAPTDYDSEELSSSNVTRTLASMRMGFEVSSLGMWVDVISARILVFAGSFDGVLYVIEYNLKTHNVHETAQIDLSTANLYSSPTSFQEECIIPHDIVHVPETGMIFVGSKTGHLIQLQLTSERQFKIVQFLRLGYTPTNLQLCKTDSHYLLVSLRNLWLFNFYSSNLPMQVIFEENTERPISRLTELPTNTDQHLRFAFSREDGLVIGSLFCHKVPLVKQISVGDPAKRVCFLDSMSLFAILCKSKDVLMRLKFADRKTNRMLPTVEVDSRLGTQRKNAIFDTGEMPLCGFVWRIQRLNRISKKLIVGTSINNTGGSVKILDVSKIVLEGATMPVVKVVELITIPRDDPVTCIEQIDSTIFFSSGCKIYSTSYIFDDKKLRPVKKLTTLSSDVISMSVNDGEYLLVNTRLDSLIVFKYHQGEDDIEMIDGEQSNESVHGELGSLSVYYKDPIARSLVNHAKIGAKLIAGDKLHSSLVIVDSQGQSSAHLFAYKLSMIPRVFISKFNGIWATEADDRDRILAVGVNGEVLAFDPIYDKVDEITKLRKELEDKRGVGGELKLDWLAERLDRPFADKVTGKGFQNIYKPFFDFAENKGKIIDYDLEDLSMVNTSSIMI